MGSLGLTGLCVVVCVAPAFAQAPGPTEPTAQPTAQPTAPPAEPPPPIEPAQVNPGPPPPAVAPTTQTAPTAKPDEKIVVKTFGRVQLSAYVDPANLGDVPDFVAPPEAVKREYNAAPILNAAIGANFSVPKPIGGFTIRGSFGVGIYIRRIFSESQGFIEAEHEGGFKVRAGKMIVPTVSTFFPGTFQYPGFYGNPAYALVGVKVSQPFGPMLAELAVGRPDFPFIPIEVTPTPESNPPLPFIEGRLAYRNPALSGELPASALAGPVKTPLTISVSGAFGQQRVGPGERMGLLAQNPMAVDPETEDLRSYVISGELVIPYRGFVLLSEIYGGRGTNLYLGGFRQRPRIDPTTGRHRVLGTGGGYVQLSYAPAKDWVALGLVGYDKVYSGLDYGIALDGGRTEKNRIIAASVSRTFGPGLKLGLQVHHLKTTYHDAGDGSMLGFIGDVVMAF